jgi:GTP-binding protein Era
MSDTHRSGFVSILGRPNAGKSTLLNALVGQKVAITADKPQTTRTAIQGVLTRPDAQIVFVDTPGIHRSDSPINRRMMEAVRASLDQRDLLLLLADANARFSEKDRHAVDLLKRGEAPTLLVINKIDLLWDEAAMLPLIDHYRSLYDFATVVPVSATRGEGLDVLRWGDRRAAPGRPPYFPRITSPTSRSGSWRLELIREKILRETREEVPHSVAVEVEKWEETPNLTRIFATVRVERPGQKGIIIGAKGAMLKKIGTLARQEMESLLDRRIFLELYVRVEPGWREKPAFLNALDWRTMAGKADEPAIKNNTRRGGDAAPDGDVPPGRKRRS